jgi:hypothetical protein
MTEVKLIDYAVGLLSKGARFESLTQQTVLIEALIWLYSLPIELIVHNHLIFFHAK